MHNHILIKGSDEEFSSFGDAGAIVVTADNTVVGLLRGHDHGNYSLVTPWETVALKCDVFLDASIAVEAVP